MANRVFVFGTLKEGFPNFKINEGRRVIGSFRTKANFPLLLVGERYSPWLVLDEGSGKPVKGQIFEVDDTALVKMDSLERTSEPDGYRKIELTVVSEDTGEELVAYAYGKDTSQVADADVRMILNGEYLLEHASLYRSRKS